MFYRVCIPLFSREIYAIDQEQRRPGQVYTEYPKAIGSFDEALSTPSSALLGNPAPNITVVNSETEFGCYSSIRNNQSDFTPILIGYPIKDLGPKVLRRELE